MFDVFQNQLDYIIFLEGLGFLAAGLAISFVHQKERGKRPRLPWLLLALFTVVQGLKEWLEIIIFYFGDLKPVVTAEFATAVLSYLLLFEFARRSYNFVNEEKQIQEALRHYAMHDTLTKAPNRLYLEDTLRRVIARAKRSGHSALLLLDLDNFKLVNDRYGHATGDEVLVAFVDLVRRHLREEDFLARLGGDEFVVILEGLSGSEAEIVAEKLRCLINNAQLCADKPEATREMSVSIGVVNIDGNHNLTELMHQVDEALYTAKGLGKNRVVS